MSNQRMKDGASDLKGIVSISWSKVANWLSFIALSTLACGLAVTTLTNIAIETGYLIIVNIFIDSGTKLSSLPAYISIPVSVIATLVVFSNTDYYRLFKGRSNRRAQQVGDE